MSSAGEVDGLTIQCVGRERLTTVDVARTAEDLQRHMPSYGVIQYFQKKGHIVLTGADYGCFALDLDGTTAALLTFNVFPDFLFINTLLIGERFQRTWLLKRMFGALFGRLYRVPGDLADLLVLKTYHPSSYCALSTFSVIPGAYMHPSIGTAAAPAAVAERMARVAAVLNPQCTYDSVTGVLKDCAYGVTEQFYVRPPVCRDDRVNEYFRCSLSASDRLLCGLYLGTNQAKERLLRKLGWRGDGHAPDVGQSMDKEMKYA